MGRQMPTQCHCLQATQIHYLLCQSRPRPNLLVLPPYPPNPHTPQVLTEVELPDFALASVDGLWDWRRRGRLVALWPLGGRGVLVILRKKTFVTAGSSCWSHSAAERTTLGTQGNSARDHQLHHPAGQLLGPSDQFLSSKSFHDHSCARLKCSEKERFQWRQRFLLLTMQVCHEKRKMNPEWKLTDYSNGLKQRGGELCQYCLPMDTVSLGIFFLNCFCWDIPWHRALPLKHTPAFCCCRYLR